MISRSGRAQGEAELLSARPAKCHADALGSPQGTWWLPQHAVQVICDHLGLAQNHGRNRCSSVTLSAARRPPSRLLCSWHLICCPTSPERVVCSPLVCSPLWAGRLSEAEKGPVCRGAGELELSDERLLCCLPVSLRLPARTTVPASPWPRQCSHLGRLCPPTETDYSVGSRNLIFRCDACRGHQCPL